MMTVVVGVAVLLQPTQLAAQTMRYVSPIGNDSSPGTESQPYRTIQAAANAVNPGDTVIVEDGIYTGVGAGTACASASSRPIVCLARGGSSTAWVTFKARNVGAAKIDGQGNTSTEGFRFLAGANYIRVEGFDVYGIANVSGSASAFELFNGGHDVVIARNEIHDIGRLCTDTSNGQVGIFVEQPRVRIEANRIHDIGRFSPNEQGCTPTNSYYKNHDHGIYVDGDAAGTAIPGASDMFIANNVFFNMGHGWAIQAFPGTLNRLTIANNTFAFPSLYQVGQIILGADTTDAQIVNNVFYNPRTAAIYYYTGTQTNLRVSENVVSNATLMTSTPSGALVSYNQVVDPKLTNVIRAPYDFHPTSASPTINMGLNMADVSVDFDGAGRVDGATDVGAYEFTGGLPIVAAPIITPDGGIVGGALTVTLSVPTADATIRYTTNGSTPDLSSASYLGPLTVAGSLTVKAKGFKSGMLESPVATAIFEAAAPPPPVSDIVPPSVAFTSPQDGARVPKNGSLTFKVAATDNIAVARVIFAVDGQPIATVVNAPYAASYNFRKAAAGRHVVTATAMDAAGNTTAATIAVVR